jgi:hypothetical protein
MPHVYYVVEAVICVTVQVFFMVMFILHIRAAHKHPESLGSIHPFAHYGGLIGSIFLIIWSLDPQGTLGIHDWRSITILKDGYTCSVYIVMVIALINSVLVISTSHGAKSNFVFWLDSHQYSISYISTALCWIIAVATDYVCIRDDWSFYYGFFLLYLAISFGLCEGLFVRTFIAFLGIKRLISPNAPWLELLFHKDSQKMRYTVGVLTGVVLAQSFFAFTCIAIPSTASKAQVAPDPTVPNFCLWELVDTMGQTLVLHLGWMPMVVSKVKLPTFQSSKNSDLKKSGSAGPKLQQVSSDQVSGTYV